MAQARFWENDPVAQPPAAQPAPAQAPGLRMVVPPSPNLPTNIFRLYGDADGSGIVNQADFIAFRNAFNAGPSSIFDFEGDGNVAQSDFFQFRNRSNLMP